MNPAESATLDYCER